MHNLFVHNIHVYVVIREYFKRAHGNRIQKHHKYVEIKQFSKVDTKQNNISVIGMSLCRWLICIERDGTAKELPENCYITGVKDNRECLVTADHFDLG